MGHGRAARACCAWLDRWQAGLLLCWAAGAGPRKRFNEGKKKNRGSILVIFIRAPRTGAARDWPRMAKESAERPAGGGDGPGAVDRG